MPEARLDPTLVRNLDRTPQEVLQGFDQCGMIHQTAIGIEGHEQVEVALGPVLTACHGAEEAYVTRPVFCGDAQDFRA